MHPTRRPPRIAAAAARLSLVLLIAPLATLGAPPAFAGVDPSAKALEGSGADGPAAVVPDYCATRAGSIGRADGLLRDRYQLGAHAVVRVAHDPTWSENPTGDPNWAFLFHSMGFVQDLLIAWQQTGYVAYRDRATALVRDWTGDNPLAHPPSIWSWNDHSTALRALAIACLADLVPRLRAQLPSGRSPWLVRMMERHGAKLADPAFYRREGNHALNQAIALLEIGRLVGRSDWRTLAAARLDRLVLASVDTQGVTNEQSIGYQAYNWKRYSLAERRLRSAGLTPSVAFGRVDRMPWMLVHSALPDGSVEMLGDTQATRAIKIPGTTNEYASTAGASGPRPSSEVALYGAGFLFARTGWGETGATPDERFTSLRFGPAPRFHGHADGGSVTLYGWGSRLIVDPGMYGYQQNAWRAFFKGRTAHNVVTVDGSAWRWATPTTLLGQTTTAAFVEARVASAGYPGVTSTRGIMFSRDLGYLIVEDRLSASGTHTFRQLWHLVDGSAPTVAAGIVTTHRTGANLVIRQLAGSPGIRIVSGRSSPIQGWISYRYGQKVAAPVVEATLRGRTARYLTLLVPTDGAPEVSVREVRLRANGYSLIVTVAGRSEWVTVSGTGVTITSIG
jgi:hypothetical protein